MKAELELTSLIVEDWGLLDYQEAFVKQEKMVAERLQGHGEDTLVLVEHPAVVTLGRRGSEADLLLSEPQITAAGVALQHINRGGLATAHEPGQLISYPIIELKQKDLRWYADNLLGAVIDVLADSGLLGELKPGEPGVWVNERKICSFGIAVKKWISSHGIALNVNNALNTFNMIVPCGRPEEKVTSMAGELGCEIDLTEIKSQFVQHFLTRFAYRLNA